MFALHPMGDQAFLMRFPNEFSALEISNRIRQANWSWIVDVVQAYTSLAVFFDPDQTNFIQASAAVGPLLQISQLNPGENARSHRIPCCYELNLDLDRVAIHAGLDPMEVIRLHSSTDFTVYAIGFCPGFPYLGYLPGPLCGVPRLTSPRLAVEPGSIGLTGRQTGIYTEKRPGGWNLIGRTPLQLVDVTAGYFPLRTGDMVRFEPIGEVEFRQLIGKRL